MIDQRMGPPRPNSSVGIFVHVRCDINALPPMFPQVQGVLHQSDSIADLSLPRGPCHRIQQIIRRVCMRMLSLAVAFAAAVGCATGAPAQTYPSHPVTLVVPFPAGGPTDTTARVITDHMKTTLGQTFVIEN